MCLRYAQSERSVAKSRSTLRIAGSAGLALRIKFQITLCSRGRAMSASGITIFSGLYSGGSSGRALRPAVDASLIEVDANKRRSIPGTEWNKDIDPEQVKRAVKDYLTTLDDPAHGSASEVAPKCVHTTLTGPSTCWAI